MALPASLPFFQDNALNPLTSFCLCDRSRAAAFSEIAKMGRQSRGSLKSATDDGIAWHFIEHGDSAIGFTCQAAGWWFEPYLRQHRSPDAPDALPLDLRLRSFRFGCQSERLVWLIHRRILQIGASAISLCDAECGAAIWGHSRAAWPKHWRGEITRLLDSLTWLHIAPQLGTAVPQFGRNSALLVHAEDLRGKGHRDHCESDCPLQHGPTHHHYRVGIGRGFLGALEECAVEENEFGVRSYAFFDHRRLRRIGRQGHLTSIYVPAKLGSPAACRALTPRQHGLLQALIQEITRNRKKDHREVTTFHTIHGSVVPDFSGKPTHCPLLRVDATYVVFGCNGVRPGRGYRISSDGGWCKKAGYPRDRPDEFLRDLISMAHRLGLVLVGAVRSHDGWLNADQMLEQSLTTPGRRVLDGVHLRIYAPHNCWDRWAELFEWTEQSAAPAAISTVDQLAITLSARGIRQSVFARQLNIDPSLLSRFLSGRREMPQALLLRATQILETSPDV